MMGVCDKCKWCRSSGCNEHEATTGPYHADTPDPRPKYVMLPENYDIGENGAILPADPRPVSPPSELTATKQWHDHVGDWCAKCVEHGADLAARAAPQADAGALRVPEPTSTKEDDEGRTYEWGPFTDALDVAEHRLVMERGHRTASWSNEEYAAAIRAALAASSPATAGREDDPGIAEIAGHSCAQCRKSAMKRGKPRRAATAGRGE